MITACINNCTEQHLRYIWVWTASISTPRHILAAKKCISKFLGFSRAMTNPGIVQRQRRSLSEMVVSSLLGSNSLLESTERVARVSRLHVDFPHKGRSMQWNGLFLNTGVRGILKKRLSCSEYGVFNHRGLYLLFNTLSKWRRYDWHLPHVFRYDLQSSVEDRWPRVVCVKTEKIWEEIFVRLKTSLRTHPCLYAHLDYSGSISTFWIIWQKKFWVFGCLSGIDVLPNKQYITSIIMADRHTSKRRAAHMDEERLVWMNRRPLHPRNLREEKKVSRSVCS